MKKIGHELANFFSGLWATELKPWLKDLLTEVEHDVVDALVPIAHEAIQQVVNEGLQIAKGAPVSGLGAALGQIAAIMAARAEAAGIQATAQAFTTAIAGALATRSTQPGA